MWVHGPGTGGEANDAERQGARDIATLKLRNRRLHGQRDIVNRTKMVGEARARMKMLSDTLPSRLLAPAAAGAGAARAGAVRPPQVSSLLEPSAASKARSWCGDTSARGLTNV